MPRTLQNFRAAPRGHGSRLWLYTALWIGWISVAANAWLVSHL